VSNAIAAPPAASVIVLGWNGRRYVDACLAALLDQAPGTPPFEVIWADNASVDGTPEHVAEAYPSVRLVRFDRNFGYAGGNVRALDHARARLVAFLNQDTIVGRRWLLSLVAAQRATGAAAVHSNMLLPWQACARAFDRGARHPDLHVAELTRQAYVAYWVEAFREARPTLFISGAGFLVDREVLPDIGGLFDPRFFAYCEDTDLALRLAASGHRAVIAGGAVMLHDLTPASALGPVALRKTLLILRNRILACARSMTARELLRMAPRLTLGAAGKVDELPMGRWRRAPLQIGMVALALVAWLWAAVELPHHRALRRRVLGARVGGPTTILDRLDDPDRIVSGPRGAAATVRPG
jgi:N-acetylglucosaminyl-diphospho-decaprenol L-rhamnosyltransferase